MDLVFNQLLDACGDLSSWFPDGLVFIGGIAVYLHAINSSDFSHLAETTHDGDFFVSLPDLIDLRDIEDITANRRLSKHQVIKNGFEFDVYVQGQSVLRVPYEQAVAGSVIYDGVRVACIEHLLALKTVAYADRRMSSKGRKDARDLLRLAVLSQVMETPIRPELLAPYLNVKEVALLESVSSGPDPMVLAKGNAHHARQFREAMDQVVAACRLPSPPSGMKP